MTEEERDNGLEDLFRKKLEDNEMEPGSTLTGRVMHSLERREFFRFNFLRFNIYYLTFALAALTVAGLILLIGPGDAEETSGTGLTQKAVTAARFDEPVLQGEAPLSGDTVKTSASQVQTATATGKSAGSLDASGTITDRITDRITGRETAINNNRPVAETVSVSTVSTAGIKAPTGRTVTAGTPAGGSIAAASTATALSIETSASSGCVPLHVSFACNAEENARISWTFGDGGTSSLRNPDYIFDIPGSFRVALTATDGRGHNSVADVVIEVWDRPEAAFEVQNNEPFDEGDKVVFLNISTGAVDYLWDFGDGVYSTLPDPSHRYAQMGKYDVMLVAWSTEGCADSVRVSDLFTGRGMYIRFPNAFIPNIGGPTGGYYNTRTDEESSVFHPVASGVTDYNLKIYSKAGMLVFGSDDIEMGWDGYYRGELCAPGVYVWKVRGTYRDGRKFIMAGDVTLLKY